MGAALLADKHSQSLQRLKIFLAGKEKRMLYGGFRWWQNCTVNSKFGIMEREVDRARKARIAAEEECAKLKAALSDESGSYNLKQQLADAQARKAEIEKAAADQTAEIEALKAKL